MEQQEFVFREHGGARDNCGRKRAASRKGYEKHRVRPSLDARTPVHVILRAKSGVPNFREADVFRAIRRHIGETCDDEFRVIHFSVQETHIHLIVEATDQLLLSRGVQQLARRITWDVNRLRQHTGSLWRDRYTRRDLTNLRQVRNALVYVLMNARKHQSDEREAFLASISFDPCSSAAWLDGWHPSAAWMLQALQLDLLRHDLHECPVAAPRTWALRVGWKQYGLIHDDEAPSNRLSTRSQASRSGHESVRAHPLSATRKAIE